MTARVVVAAFALFVAAPVWAQAKVIAGRGRISLAPSVSYVPDGPFTANAEAALGAQRSNATPLSYGGWASFGYGASEVIEVALDLMASTQSIEFEGREAFNRLTYGGGAGAKLLWQADIGSLQLQPRLGLGVMGSLVYVTGGGVEARESFLTTYFAGAGADLVVSDSFGVQLEYRFLLGRGRAPGEIGGSINAGGHFLLLGISWYLLGEPPHRSEKF